MMLRPNQIKSDNLAFVPTAKRETAIAALKFLRAVEDGWAVEPPWVDSRLSIPKVSKPDSGRG